MAIIKRKPLEEINAYVPGKPIDEVERELGVKVIAKMASNENALGPSPLAVKAVVEFVSKLHLYPDGSGYHIKQALSHKFDIDPAQILMANGSDESIGLIAQTFINPGDEGIIPVPSFPQYEFALRVMGGVPRKVPLKVGFEYDLEAMLKAINKRTRLIFLCTPNNPTGTIISRAEMDRFFAHLPENILVILDEAYLEYVTQPGYFNSLDYIKQGLPVISLRTFSKIYGLAGLRIGYAIAQKKCIADISTVREPFNVNSLAQAAAVAVLEDHDYLARGRELVEKGKRQLGEGLSGMGFKCIPTEANFLFVNLGIDAREVFQKLLKQGVIIRPGDIYGFPHFARITIGTPAENELFLQKLAIIAG